MRGRGIKCIKVGFLVILFLGNRDHDLGSNRISFGSGHFRVNMILFRFNFELGYFQFGSTSNPLIFDPISFV